MGNNIASQTLNKKYRTDIDFVKGASIIAVILYHFGIDKTGYLGVDAFLVINGFLIIPGICRRIEKQDFKYFFFLGKRLVRFVPVLYIACIVCLTIGYIGMLPDDYENLSQQVFASSTFSNNILQAITTKNYWNVVNDFKPLMHTWYLGICMQFYITFPIIMLLTKAFCNKAGFAFSKVTIYMLAFLGLVSFALFIIPSTSAGNKFYLIPFRYFEFIIGGVVAYSSILAKNRKVTLNSKSIIIAAFCLILLTMFYGMVYIDIHHLGGQVVPIGADITNTNLLFPNWLLVTMTVLFCASILAFNETKIVNFSSRNIIVLIGKRSYSLFIWHQVIVAFYRYFISYEIDPISLLLLFILIICISELSYRLIERRNQVFNKKFVLLYSPVFVFIIISSLLIYSHAGVVRDVPELEIYKNEVHRNMNSEYCDRIFQYDHMFSDNGKTKILIVGNSFARDWGNILLESKYKDDIDISYSYTFNKSILNRIRESDYIFAFMNKTDIPQYVWNNITHDNVWGIGTKNFGESNGIIYSKRRQKNYFDQTIELSKPYEELNNKWSQSWGDKYIDMISYVLNQEGRVRVFSDEKLFLSQDCHHLTKGGAQYYSRIIDFKTIFVK